MPMICECFQDLLADDLSAPLSQEASDHIAACSHCHSLYTDLLAITGVGREWGAEEVEPPARLWAAIQNQLETEGLIAQPAALPAMLCERFQDLLADDLTAPLPSEASDHIAACTGCRALYTDLLVIAGAGREWGAEAAEPPARLWAAIQNQLEAEGLIARPAAPPVSASHGWLSGWWNIAARLETAGAYVLLLLLAAGIAGYQFAPGAAVQLQDRPATAVQFSRPALDGLGRTLDGNMKFAVASLSPDYGDSLTVSIEKNLQIVDNLIAVCEKKVRENPYDPLAREYLYGAYQQKADLLSVAWDRSALEAQ